MTKGNTVNQRSRHLAGLIAGVAATSLLLGGGTLALWSATVTQHTAATIVNGSLDVTVDTSASTFYDVTRDRVDATATAPVTNLAGHAIPDISAWHFVPGDTVQVNVPFTVSLAGDNLIANMKLDSSGFAASGALVSGIAQAYTVDGGVYTPLGAATPLSTGTIDLGNVQPENEQGGADNAGIPVVDTAADNVVVVVTLTFDENATAQQLAGLSNVLGDLTLTLTQVLERSL